MKQKLDWLSLLSDFICFPLFDFFIWEIQNKKSLWGIADKSKTNLVVSPKLESTSPADQSEMNMKPTSPAHDVFVWCFATFTIIMGFAVEQSGTDPFSSHNSCFCCWVFVCSCLFLAKNHFPEELRVGEPLPGVQKIINNISILNTIQKIKSKKMKNNYWQIFFCIQ